MVIVPCDLTYRDIALDVRSRIMGFGESCSIVRGITSQPTSVSSNVLCVHFRHLQLNG